jgi:protein-disulfide isomerase
MSYRFRWPAAAALLLTLLVFAPLPAAAADSFTSEQRKELEGIVHDYLLAHPDVMLEVLQAAESRIKSDSHDKAAKALTEHKNELLADPNSPVAGNPQGDVTVVEFFDYRCPYCKQVEPAIEALVAEDRQLKFVYKEFPVLGPESVTASRAALAARKQGKYDALHRALMGLKGQIN